ncbi:DUF5710 domain-containing protein [Acerihabitans sp. TG2]|uniref:DUF5710 domain-containing protein n=1 Tax=Acerihabitans sp. TG2 TaxID=3096008 RepID=UPI002B22D0BC|nr:DUF5710 domain-containing protein [Acerihabitans sp. TG2]MEA9392186.1 DUF5710 domain-containing protein [Acerihabitans sp. TG2]
MKITFGYESWAIKNDNKKVPVEWNSKTAVNPHMVLIGMSGAGKTYNLKKMVAQMCNSYDYHHQLRVHVFDVHGDIELEGASTVFFSEQTRYGLNPLEVNPDPDFGGVRKRVQSFMSTMNKVMHSMGSKQESTLRNLLIDLYARHGFVQDDPKTWKAEPVPELLTSPEHADRVYLDVPFEDKSDANRLGAQWDGIPGIKAWWIPEKEYTGGITRWPPKSLRRANPTTSDLVRFSRHVLLKSFLGTSQDAVTKLEAVNKIARTITKRGIDLQKTANLGSYDEKILSDFDKAKDEALDRYKSYLDSLSTGMELEDIIKYSSTDVLKSVLERIQNIEAMGVFKPETPPFDTSNPVWRYNIKALGLEERRLFVLFKLEEIFMRAVERGEQSDVCEVIVLDEAKIYLDSDPDNILNKIANEARKFGLALIAAGQTPVHFTADFIAATATKVVLGVDESYWKQSSNLMRIDEKQLKWIKPKRTMMVQIKASGMTATKWEYVCLPQTI